MELAYLGLFTKVFNWVMDKIFDPVFKFISDLLSTVLSWVFNEILAPILFPVLEEVLEFAIDLYKTIYSFQLYSMFSGVLKIIDYLEIAFDVFIGRSNVTYTTDSGQKISGTLLEILVQHEMVTTVFWALTLGGIGIALMLTIFGTAKSAFDLDFENKRPVSKVLTAMMKCFIQFFMVPLFVYFMLILATDILNITIDAITGGTGTTMGRILFMIASLNASRTEGLNADYLAAHGNASGIVLGTSPEDYVRFPFYIKNAYVTNAGKTITPMDYTSVKEVNKYFNLADFDYLIGFLAAIFLLFVMAVCIVIFVQRIFEIILLFIVSPYFVSTMPLDDGAKFGRWRDLFIGKCFTGFGSAIGMRLYLIVCQMLMGGSIRFTAEEIGSSIEIDYFMKLFFLLGGAWAVFKSGPMVTTLISSGAGQQEAMMQAGVGGALYGHTIGKAMHAGRGALMSAVRGRAAAKAKNRNAQNADPNQKFDGSKNDKMANAAQANGLNNKPGVNPLLNGQSGLLNSTDKPGLADKKDQKFDGNAGADQKPKIDVNLSDKQKPDADPADKPKIDVNMPDKQKPDADQEQNGGLKPAEKPTVDINAANTAAQTAQTAKAAPQERRNIQLGSLFQSTYDDKGNHKISVLGFGVNKDAAGNTMAFSMPIMGMKLQRMAPNQKMKLAQLNVPGITRISSSVQNGELKYSDVSILGGAVSYQSDSSNSRVRVLGGLTDVTTGKGGHHVSVMGGLGQYNSTDQMTHVGVAGIHHYDTSVGTVTNVGSLVVHRGAQGSTVMLGNDISIQTSGDRLQSMKIGSLEYSRVGISKDAGTASYSGATQQQSAPQVTVTPPVQKVTVIPPAQQVTPPVQKVTVTPPVQQAKQSQQTDKPGSGN